MALLKFPWTALHFASAVLPCTFDSTLESSTRYARQNLDQVLETLNCYVPAFLPTTEGRAFGHGDCRVKGDWRGDTVDFMGGLHGAIYCASPLLCLNVVNVL